MKRKFILLTLVFIGISVAASADIVTQLDAGLGPGVASQDYWYKPDTYSINTNFQSSWYDADAGIGFGLHLNTFQDMEKLTYKEIGLDFVLASPTNKFLWNVGGGLTTDFYIPNSFHVNIGFQEAFGNSNHRFALREMVSFNMIEDKPSLRLVLFLNYSFNNAAVHGRL
ncbi:hypothetical protein AGMMS49940_23090 [Spirochaetia bacterium]|nr:hypothetical protein AGMMS49940_23090 [Spirochaetia bacterium]